MQIMLSANLAGTLQRGAAALLAFVVLSVVLANVYVLCSLSSRSVLYSEWLPSVSGGKEQRIGTHAWRNSREPGPMKAAEDEHPIKHFMQDADKSFENYNSGRSKTFKEAVAKYRERYGRHPPPGFKDVRLETW